MHDFRDQRGQRVTNATRHLISSPRADALSRPGRRLANSFDATLPCCKHPDPPLRSA